jgi:hypothetical protein
MMGEGTSKREPLARAIELATDRLRTVDLESRCPILGLPAPHDGKIAARMLGADTCLNLGSWTLTILPSGEPARAGDLLLLLHYLACELPVKPTGELVSFRSLPGGQFYFPAFQGRTATPLVQRFGNDLGALREHLERFDHEPTGDGDLGARIHAFGNLHVTLVYHTGDDELPPAADILFDRCISRAFGAEDAAVLAGRICIGLL